MKTAREWAARSLANIASSLAPGVIAYIIARIRPEDVASLIRPHIQRVIGDLPPQWQGVYVSVLRKMTEIAEASIPK